MRILEIADRLAEGTAFLRIAQRDIQSGFRAPQGTSRDIQAPAIQPRHREAEALPFLTENSIRAHARIFENHLACRLRIPAHFAFIGAEGKPGRFLRDQQRGNAIRAVTARAQHGQIKIRCPSARDELLGAIQDIALIIARGTRLQRGGIAAGTWLRQAIGCDGLHCDQLRQPGAALRIIAEAVDHPGDHVMDGHEGANGGATHGKGFKHHRRVQAREARAA